MHIITIYVIHYVVIHWEKASNGTRVSYYGKIIIKSISIKSYDFSINILGKTSMSLRMIVRENQTTNFQRFADTLIKCLL